MAEKGKGMSFTNIVSGAVSPAAPSATPAGMVPNYAALPQGVQGLYLVIADETKGGNPTIYFFNGPQRYWVAMVQDA